MIRTFVVIALLFAVVHNCDAAVSYSLSLNDSAVVNCVMPSSYPYVADIYLLMHSANGEDMVLGWEASIDIIGDGMLNYVAMLHTMLNVKTPPEYMIGY